MFTLTLLVPPIIIGLLLLFHLRALSNARAEGLDMGKRQGWLHGLNEGRRQVAQERYAQGYTEGRTEGRELERREWMNSANKAYDRGYQAAIDELSADNVAAMHNEARHTISA